MLLTEPKKTICDVLIVGGGGAGLRAAIAAASAGADVLMVSKTRIGHATNTYLSKAIIAASGWGDPGDNSAVHSTDTLQGGRHLNNPEMVARFTGRIHRETALLQEWGVEFGMGEGDRPALFKIPGHSYARHLFGKNWKGSDLVLPLKKKAMETGVRFHDRLFISSLIISGGRVCGATGISDDGTFMGIEAKTVILATGGFGHLYLNTNNAPGINGDGQALAGRAGAVLQDMEFVQFYPTALGKRGSRILLYEHLLLQPGVVLRNSRGEDILQKKGYLSPVDITRDQLAQVIMAEILADPDQNGTIDMDLTSLSPESAEAFSRLLPAQWAEGFRVFQVTPTAHFCMGGIVVDGSGETSCPALFAVGEVTAGAHGANRLGGNALAEVIAMGSLVGKAAADKAATLDRAAGVEGEFQGERSRLESFYGTQGASPASLIQELKAAMWVNAGIVRNRQSLCRALETLTGAENAAAAVANPGDLIRVMEFRNMQLVAEMVCRAALERTESRGAHFRDDYPVENDDAWLKNIQIRKTESGLVLDLVPVSG